MNDATLPDDIADMIKILEGVEADVTHGAGPVRFIVATDWTDGAAALALLKAFRVIFRPEQPVQLVFAVPHDPTEEDAACVQVLSEGAGGDVDLRGLDVMSFAGAADAAYDSAVVPDGDDASLLTQVAGLIVRMHDVARTLDAGGAAGPDGNLTQGASGPLRTRLAAFSTGS